MKLFLRICVQTWTWWIVNSSLVLPLIKKCWRVRSSFQTNSIILNGFCGCNQRACIIEFSLLKCPSCYPSSNPRAFVGERATLAWKQSHLCSALVKNGCQFLQVFFRPFLERSFQVLKDTSPILCYLECHLKSIQQTCYLIMIIAAVAARLSQKKQFLRSSVTTPCVIFPFEQADGSLDFFPSTARQIQGAPCIRSNVWSAVVRPPGGFWEREEPGALHTQHSARLFLFLQVSVFCVDSQSCDLFICF